MLEERAEGERELLVHPSAASGQDPQQAEQVE